ncbi:hypothetical protein PSI22_06955 [Xenorhabdus sp. XENO-7]|uniref:Bacteriophage T7 Gp17 C-terminal domain-containing protein n=1 Tax=Xenorhabdus aichiensis TaxID=3025874 RepID=A0ABT5M1N6_9GAMM|nr:hypothetical protein [Xenorhabdus aichiensis]
MIAKSGLFETLFFGFQGVWEVILASDRRDQGIVENLGLAETKNQAQNALPRSGGEVTGDITISTDSEISWRRNTDMAAIGFKNTGDGDTDSYMWFKTADNGNEYFKWQHSLSGGGTNEWMSLKSDNLRVKGHQVYHEGHKPTAEAIQAEPRFNTTIDLTGLSSDRYYPVWWRFPSNDGANSWLTMHRYYAEDREKEPFGKGVTHLAGLSLQIEGGDTPWGGDAHYLNIKRIHQRYRNTVKNIRYGMMSIARPIEGKYPLYQDAKSGDIVECYTLSGCYLRGGLTYHVTSNFSGIRYSRNEEEVEIDSSLQSYNNFEIKWMAKSYAIDDPILGKEYDDTVLPYAHDYAETINLATKNAVSKSAITQFSGNSAEQVMSQKVVTSLISERITKSEADDKYLPRYSKLDTQVGLLSINNGSNWPGLVYVAENGHRIGIEGSQGKILTIWANDPADNRLYNLQTPQKSGTLATLDDIVATKNTSKKDPNGWWKCGDTGLIIQWGIVENEIGAGTIDVPLSINFPTRGLWAIGYVNDAIDYERDNCSSSAKLLNNEKIRVTVDNSLPSVWLAMGY